MLSRTAKIFDTVSLSPQDEGNIAAKISVKKLEVELSNVTMAVSLGSRASWNM